MTTSLMALAAIFLVGAGEANVSHASAASPETTAQADAALLLPAKTVVDIEITDNISSKTAVVGDGFNIKLTEPVRIGDRLILPIGTAGRGEVTHVAKAGWGGKPGELIVMARYLMCGDQKIPLGHFHFGSSGEAHLTAAALVPFGFLINGDEMLIPAGTRGNARVSAEMSLPPAIVQQCRAT